MAKHVFDGQFGPLMWRGKIIRETAHAYIVEKRLGDLRKVMKGRSCLIIDCADPVAVEKAWDAAYEANTPAVEVAKKGRLDAARAAVEAIGTFVEGERHD